jgi:hypothetical protein
MESLSSPNVTCVWACIPPSLFCASGCRLFCLWRICSSTRTALSFRAARFGLCLFCRGRFDAVLGFFYHRSLFLYSFCSCCRRRGLSASGSSVFDFRCPRLLRRFCTKKFLIVCSLARLICGFGSLAVLFLSFFGPLNGPDRAGNLWAWVYLNK